MDYSKQHDRLVLEKQRFTDMDEALTLSRKIHNAMLPVNLPRTQQVHIDTFFMPGSRVGGNCYDVIKLSDDHIAVMMFDIEDVFDVNACLMNAFVKVLFTNRIHEITTPQRILEAVVLELNRIFPQQYTLQAFMGFLDLNSNRLVYSLLRNVNPFVYRANTKMLELLRTDETNPKTSFSFHCEQNVCNLLPGDWVILLSRGAVNQFFKNDGKDAQAYLEKSILTGKYQNVTEWLATYRKLDTINTLTNEKVVDRAVIAIEILSQQSRKKIIRLLGFPEDKPVFLQFLSTYEEIDTVTPRILKEMDEAGYNDETIRKMKLTVTELLANAIGHGNQNEPRKKVTVGHVVEPEMTLVGVMDEGDGFDPAIIPDPTLPENLIKDHGRGLYIVGNYIDEMLFNKKGNRILIKKNRLRRT